LTRDFEYLLLIIYRIAEKTCKKVTLCEQGTQKRNPEDDSSKLKVHTSFDIPWVLYLPSQSYPIDLPNTQGLHKYEG
jgi:hypothetical protein